MKSFSLEALGTLLEIHIHDTNTHQVDIDECFSYIESFERDYSRFIAGNLLAQVNKNGKGKLTPEMSDMIEVGLEMYQKTHGHFDVTLLPLLENAGYGIESSVMNIPVGSQHIEVQGDTLLLHEGVNIDFGGLGKGYLLDKVYEKLIPTYSDFVLNFGGDIRVSGTQTIFLEDPLRPGKNIGEYRLNNGSFCSSNGVKRKLHTGHHIINPISEKSPDDKIALYTFHPQGVYADAYATALFACPLEVSLQVLEKTPDLEALIISQEGKFYASEGFQKYLTLFGL